MIYVTEPFSRSRHVKLDDASKDPADVLDVLKLNLERHFQTGIYDYRTMVSLFMKVVASLPPRHGAVVVSYTNCAADEIRSRCAKQRACRVRPSLFAAATACTSTGYWPSRT